MADIQKAFEILISADSKGAEQSFSSLAEQQDKAITASTNLTTVSYSLADAIKAEEKAAAGAKSQMEKLFPTFSGFLGIGDKFKKALADPIGLLSTNLFSLTDVAKYAAVGVAGFGASALGAAAGVTALAAAGGELAENRSQFENLAKTAGESADSIIKDVKEISQNTLTLKDSFELSGKALNAGFSGDQIKTAFAFAKKASEASGEDFRQLAETIVTSMAKGRFATLEAFGVTIEKGASVTEAFKALEKATEKYGEAAFNTADLVASLSVSFIDFKDRIGEAINATPEFQQVFISLESSAREFIDTFDFKVVSDFTARSITAFEILGSDIIKSFDGVGDALREFFGGDFGSLGFFEKFIKGFFTIKGVSASVFNAITTFIQFEVNNFDFLFGTVSKAIVEIPLSVTNAVYKVEAIIGKSLLTIVDKFEALSGKFPKLSKLLGLDDAGLLGQAKNQIKGLFEDQVEAYEAARRENELFIEEYVKGIDEQAAARQKYFEDKKIDIDQIAEDELAAIERIKKTSAETKKAAGDSKAITAEKKKSLLEIREEEERAAEATKVAKKRQIEDFLKGEADYLKEKKRLLQEETSEALKEYEKQFESKRELFELGLSNEEKAFRRQQEDQARAFKKQQEQEVGKRTNLLKFGLKLDDVDVETALSPLLKAQEEAARDFARQREDATDAFKREIEQRKKAQEDADKEQLEAEKNRLEEIIRLQDRAAEERLRDQKRRLEDLERAGASISIPPLPSLSAPSTQALKDLAPTGQPAQTPAGPGQQTLKIELVNSGGLADTLLGFIFKEAKLRAIADGTKVLAP